MTTSENTTDTLTFVVSAGHGEYLPDEVTGLTVETIWDVDDTELDMNEDERKAFVVSSSGLPADRVNLDEIDLDWETVQVWSGSRRAVEAGLQSLLDVLARTPSGDDDTFDYWPSGLCLAHQVAVVLDRDTASDWTARVSRTFEDHVPADVAHEIALKLSFEAP